jgi:hypothetical protein
MSIQLNEVAAVVTQYIDKELPDGLQKRNPLWNYFLTKGKKKVSGGTSLQFPIKLLKNLSSSAISGSGAILDTSPSAQLQYGVLNWKYYYFAINFSLADFTQAADAKESVIDMIKAKKDGAKEDFYRSLSTDVYGSGSTATTSLAINGLADIVAGTGVGYAGLYDTDYTDANSPYLPYISTATALSYPVISDMITQSRARRQQMGVNGKIMGLMNPYLFNQMLGILQNQQLFVNGNKMVNAGFESFNINGVDVYMDVDTPGTGDGTTADNYLYIIPEDCIQLMYKYGIDSPSPLDGQDKLPNTNITTIQKFSAWNVVCNNRRVISVAKNLQ